MAFIPLRGGSRSIPLKNIKLLNGRPLCYYALDAADQCPEIDTIVVSTDSEEIKECVLKHPSQKIKVISRSPEVSTDVSPTNDVFLEFAEAYTCKTIVLIQATSPLLQAGHVSAGLAKHAQGYDAVVSVVRQHRFLWSEDGRPLNYDPLRRPRRQDWGGILIENGAFYITTHAALIKNRATISGKMAVSEMPAHTYVELDEPSDWLFVEALLQKARRKGKA